MIEEFNKLNEEEKALMYDAIPLVTILVAGADGVIDEKEKDWAAKITHIRSYTHSDSLKEYFEKLDSTYTDRFNALMEALPQDAAERQKAVEAKLAQLNDILPKVEHFMAKHFYDELKSFALHVAKASGGVFGIGSVSKAEKEVMDLHMINPID